MSRELTDIAAPLEDFISYLVTCASDGFVSLEDITAALEGDHGSHWIDRREVFKAIQEEDQQKEALDCVSRETYAGITKYLERGFSSRAQSTTCTADALQTRALNRHYLDNARARNTIRGYRSDWIPCEAWCNCRCRNAMPAAAETIAQYLAERAGFLKVSTLAHGLAAITKAHKAAGHASPVKDNMLIAETLKGINRIHGTAPVQKSPVLTDDLRMMFRHLPSGNIGIRDRALLLVGFVGALRRSELVSLEVTDLTFTNEGLLLTLRRSKTDQDRAGRKTGIPFGTLRLAACRPQRSGWRVLPLQKGPCFGPYKKTAASKAVLAV